MSWYLKNSTVSRFGTSGYSLDSSDATAEGRLDACGGTESATEIWSYLCTCTSGGVLSTVASATTYIGAWDGKSLRTSNLSVTGEVAIPEGGGVALKVVAINGCMSSGVWYSPVSSGHVISAGTHVFSFYGDDGSFYFGNQEAYLPNGVFVLSSPPSAPSGVQLSTPTASVPTSAYTSTLSWGEVTGVTGYKVYGGTSPNPTTLVSTVTGATSLDFTFTTGASSYYSRIKAYNAQGDSEYSTETSASIPSIFYPTQNCPSYVYDDRFTIMWDEYSGASSYDIYVGTTGFVPSSGSLYSTHSSGTTHVTVTGQAASTEYEAIVKASTTGGYGYSRRRHITTTESGAAAIIQDGDYYMGQVTFSKIPSSVSTSGFEVCLGLRPSYSHGDSGDSPYFIDTRSDGVHRHFHYRNRQLASSGSGWYFTMTTGASGELVGNANASEEVFSAYVCASQDSRGFEWGELVAQDEINGQFDVVASLDAPILTLSNGTKLMFAYTTSGSANYDAQCFASSGDCMDWYWYSTVSSGSTSAAEPQAVIISGAYPNETIVCLFRPHNSWTSPYFTMSLDSGVTWTAEQPTDIGSDVDLPSNEKDFGRCPPQMYYDLDAGRLWCVLGNRDNSGTTGNGIYLFRTDTPTAASGWSLACRVASSEIGAVYPVQDMGRATIVDVGEELWIAWTETVGVPIGDGGYSNEYIAFKAFTKDDIPQQLELTKYTPETEPFGNKPEAPTLSVSPGTDSINLSWGNIGGNYGYEVYRRTSGAFSMLGVVGQDVVEYSDPAVESEIEYTYKVITVGFFENSDSSNDVTSTLLQFIGGSLFTAGFNLRLTGGFC